ncbi:MAG: glycosyltransferase family 4 protein [Candidatus Thorarchaeota archaeon]
MARKLKNIQFTGYVSYNTLIALLNSADIFLFPTREENQGIAFLEALLYGKPAVISDHPVFKEYIDGTHVMKAKNINEYVNKINELINNKELGTNLVLNAQKYLEVHDIKKSIRSLAEIYQTITE